jgi:hypothetical protein
MNAEKLTPCLIALFLLGCTSVDRWAERLPGKEGGRADWDKTGSSAAEPGDSRRSPAAAAATATMSMPESPGSRDPRHAEQFAKGAGCERPAATLNYKTASAEVFTVTCANADARSIRCESGDCRELK